VPRVINEDVPCAICKTAKPRRFCPGVNDSICPGCCGTGREQTIDCPLTCEFLAEAHRHEKKPSTDPEAVPNKDIALDDDFLRANEFLIVLAGSAMFEALRPHPHALDADAVDGLNALVNTWRARTSGLIVETRPVNPIAADVFDSVQARVEDIGKSIAEAEAGKKLPDSVVVGVLVFLQRVAFGLNNGRAKCKAFLVFLSQFYVDLKRDEAEAAAEEPRVIL
jgi:hypothetical protein